MFIVKLVFIIHKLKLIYKNANKHPSLTFTVITVGYSVFRYMDLKIVYKTAIASRPNFQSLEEEKCGLLQIG